MAIATLFVDRGLLRKTVWGNHMIKKTISAWTSLWVTMPIIQMFAVEGNFYSGEVDTNIWITVIVGTS